jgi:hypothetical protein
VGALTDQTLATLSAAQTSMSNTVQLLADITTQTEAQAIRSIMDTMIMDEASGEWEYVWENCGNATYSGPMPSMTWRFNVTTYSSPGQLSSHRRNLLTTTLRVAAKSSKDNNAAWRGYRLTAIDDVYAVGFEEPFPTRDRIFFR